MGDPVKNKLLPKHVLCTWKQAMCAEQIKPCSNNIAVSGHLFH